MTASLIEKRCSKCNKVYPATTKYFHSHSTHKDKLSSQCRDCINFARRAKGRTPAIRKVAKKAKLKFLYGLKWEDYERMYLQQKGCCAICEVPVNLTKINVDHNHETNEVRGLLCSSCNTFVGFIEGRGYLLNRIKKYLRSK